jgi:Ca2+-binding EF-hand superfamily protein
MIVQMDTETYVFLIKELGNIKSGEEKIRKALAGLHSGVPVSEYIDEFRTNKLGSWKVRRMTEITTGNSPQVQLAQILGVSKEEYDDATSRLSKGDTPEFIIKRTRLSRACRIFDDKNTGYADNERTKRILTTQCGLQDDEVDAMLEEMNPDYKTLGKFKISDFIDKALSK